MNKKYIQFLDDIKEGAKELPKDKDDNVLIIDGLNNFIRVYSAVPTLNDDGDHVGGISGFLQSIAAAIRLHNPTRCIIVFDGKGGSLRRRKIFPDYKQKRLHKTPFNRALDISPEDERVSMGLQFQRVIEYLTNLPVTILSLDNIEADDVMAYIAKNLLKSKVCIMSTDKDFLQLVNERIRVWSPVKKKLYDVKLLHEEFGINHNNFIWYRVFDGDKSDNIPGIPGAGLKTIKKYIPILSDNEFKTLDQINKYIAGLDKKYKIHETIYASNNILERNYKLMQLNDVDISGNHKSRIKDIVAAPINKLNVLEFKKMFMQDKLFTNIKNLDYWLNQSFRTLNAFALNRE